MNTSEITMQLKQKKGKHPCPPSLPRSSPSALIVNNNVPILTQCEREISLFDVIPTEFLHLAVGEGGKRRNESECLISHSLLIYVQ